MSHSPALPPLRFRGLDHAVLRIADPVRALRFYEGVLGLRLERVIENLGIYQLRCGQHLIDLLHDASYVPHEPGDLEHLCLMLDCELEAALARLEAAGVAVESGPVEVYGATGFGTSVYLRDPDGHRLELKAPYAVTPLRVTLPPPAGDQR